MQASEVIWLCRACGAEPVMPGMDLTWLYGHYFGLTVVGECVIGDMFTDGQAFEFIVDWVQSGVARGELPQDAAKHSLQFRLLEVAIDRAPSGHPYCCYLRVCPECDRRALMMNYVDNRPRLPGDVPSATFTSWRSLSSTARDKSLRQEAERALADPWFVVRW